MNNNYVSKVRSFLNKYPQNREIIETEWKEGLALVNLLQVEFKNSIHPRKDAMDYLRKQGIRINEYCSIAASGPRKSRDGKPIYHKGSCSEIYKRYITVNQLIPSDKDLMIALGVDQSALSQTRSRLRKAGYIIKKMPDGRYQVTKPVVNIENNQPHLKLKNKDEPISSNSDIINKLDQILDLLTHMKNLWE